MDNLRIGDVVIIHSNGSYDGLTGVIESKDFNGNHTVSILYGEGEKKVEFNQSALEFMYHDKAQAEAIYESAQNMLPEWRGDLYSLFQLEYEHRDHLDFIEIYEDHTAPLKYMKDIIRKHAFRKRMREVLSYDHREEIEDRLRWDYMEIYQSAEKIHDRIKYINDPSMNGKNVKMKSMNLDDRDWKFIQTVCEFDKEKLVTKDPFPINMSDYNIMLSIKQAYMNAEKKRITTHWHAVVRRQGQERVKDTILF